MLVSIAEEMNPTRRNTMEDVHVVKEPGSWDSPNDKATFIGVYDGHGGRNIVDYLEDHLHSNVANEWCYAAEESRLKQAEMSDDRKLKRRRLANDQTNLDSTGGKENVATVEKNQSDYDIEEEARYIRLSLERAFLLTDIQSRMAGLSTSGATVVCCIVIPKFSADGSLRSIEVHAANAGDARAVLSSKNAEKIAHCDSGAYSESGSVPASEKSNSKEFKNKNDSVAALRITHDHKSTDADEIERIEKAGGVMIRGRVLGVLAVARSLGDHGLKEFVIGRPYLSSTVIQIEKERDKSESRVMNECSIERRRGLNSSECSPLTDGDFLIVACDGLWDVMEDHEAVNLVRKFTAENPSRSKKCSKQEVASFLIEEALRRGSTDNITVVVCWL
mmetsp:Transcript_19386/g.40281  ORF Transcript_19386/g.40281 Transcript_19386/m.40281 type:complete len:390 (+) Transcript_19386:88-1257(+)